MTTAQIIAVVQLGLCVWALLIIQLSDERPPAMRSVLEWLLCSVFCVALLAALLITSSYPPPKRLEPLRLQSDGLLCRVHACPESP